MYSFSTHSGILEPVRGGCLPVLSFSFKKRGGEGGRGSCGDVTFILEKKKREREMCVLFF